MKLTSNISVDSCSINIPLNKYPGQYRKGLYFRLFAIGFISAKIWNWYLLNGGTVFHLHLSKDSSNYTIFAIYSITKYSLFWNTKQVCTHMQHSSLRSLHSHWWNPKVLEKKNHLVCQQWHNVAQKQSAEILFSPPCVTRALSVLLLLLTLCSSACETVSEPSSFWCPQRPGSCAGSARVALPARSEMR